MRKNYVYNGYTATLMMPINDVTAFNNIAGTVQSATIVGHYYATIKGIGKKKTGPRLFNVLELGFYCDPIGVYYLTAKTKKV